VEAIILVGGLGTRLRSVISDIPKPMAPVAGRPFLAHVLDYLSTGPVTKVILATGYRAEMVSDYFGTLYNGLRIEYSVEDQPLGTGGAISKALGVAEGEDVFVLNGDTFFAADLGKMKEWHQESGARVTIALKHMKDFDRFGSVCAREGRIVSFAEKTRCAEGYINGGIYLVKRDLLHGLGLPERFSFETDFLEKRVTDFFIGAFPSDGYFLDIGIPEDYAKAQRELPGLCK
jgi:D-glycero-alpha-D-manno-heptose 1-phosphate guanylyltransferase